ncbi:hypothetical protein CPLU01_03806 [Colletotrichum plurivorum]|uniref:Heme oxygenase n=1 Tax=Colletotrichum plurivorum TaxID=2175906 RepID=A0A8H6KS51_9PEZI|nr:hypothetical protein CPLU01_03806 [Colletotrichum plurivorum]
MASKAAPPAEEPQRSLSESIAAATRSSHAKLNKLIIARLPLAIPPRAEDPSIYVSGLLHITPIYTTFETLWQAIVEDTQSSSGEVKGDGCKSDSLSLHAIIGTVLKHQANVCDRTRSILTSLYLPGLMRSEKLRSDIGSLTGWSPEVVEQQLKAVAKYGRLADFTKHVRRTIEKKPHVLVAYSYILFMALFAGGRFIRATLESAGSDFWEQVPSPIPPSGTLCIPRPLKEEEPAAAAPEPVDLMRGDTGTVEPGARHTRHALPLSFFRFATVLDGEDLKKEFKKRLADSESLLTARERHDIIQEAARIFDYMLLLVGQLDIVCESTEDGPSLADPWASLGSGGRLRDSVIVTRERREKGSSKGESGPNSRRNSWICQHRRHQKSDTGEPLSPVDADGQPPACCPASSMRFEPNLPVPNRSEDDKPMSTDGAANDPRPSPVASTSAAALLLNFLLVAGLAAIAAMVVLGRRSRYGGGLVQAA